MFTDWTGLINKRRVISKIVWFEFCEICNYISCNVNNNISCIVNNNMNNYYGDWSCWMVEINDWQCMFDWLLFLVCFTSPRVIHHCRWSLRYTMGSNTQNFMLCDNSVIILGYSPVNHIQNIQLSINNSIHLFCIIHVTNLFMLLLAIIHVV